MTNNNTATQENLPSNQDISRPFTFRGHNFGAHCFDTIGCKVFYANRYVVLDEEDRKAPSPKNADFYVKLSASDLDIPNFPSPAVVNWKSKDGTSHKAEVDIAKIFSDHIIRHNVAKEDLPTETIATLDNPDIVLVVNDRTINVYMRATMYLKDTPTRKRAQRDDMILSFTQTY
ncbi:MAG: hypothetical protein ABI644_03235 [Arenimonas sp.]